MLDIQWHSNTIAELLGSNEYFDEDLRRVIDINELSISNEGLLTTKINDGFSVNDFYRLIRPFRLLATLRVNALSSISSPNKGLLFNSLLDMSKPADLATLGQPWGISPTEMTKCINLFTWNPEDDQSFFELQYTPFVKVGTRYVIPWFTFSESALIRNVFLGNKVNLRDNGFGFEDEVLNLIKSRFKHATANKTIDNDDEEAELDVLCYADNQLFVFECKYSIPAASEHEAGGIWSDIITSLDQLERVSRILKSDSKLKERFVSWFPDLSATDVDWQHLVIKPVVLTSTRNWGGLTIGGVPIRDFYSFRNWLDKAEVALKILDNNKFSEITYSLENPDSTAAEHLNNYLDDFGTIWRVNFTGMIPYSDFLWESGSYRIVRDTWGRMPDPTPEQTMALLDQLGATSHTKTRSDLG